MKGFEFVNIAELENKDYCSCVIRLDKAEDGWIKQLENLDMPAVISPLHDRDIREETQKLRFPHYHIMIQYPGISEELAQSDGTISWENSIARDRMREIGLTQFHCPVNVGAYFRRMCGIRDFTEDCLFGRQLQSYDEIRQQYPIDEIIELNGIDYRALAYVPTADSAVFNVAFPPDIDAAGRILFDMIDSYQFFSFSYLDDFLEDKNLTPDRNWFVFCRENMSVFQPYIIKRDRHYRKGYSILSDTSHPTWKLKRYTIPLNAI